MRTFVAILIVGGLGVVFVLQKKNTVRENITTESAVPASSPVKTTSASPAREPSEQNWMKRSLDRAHDVAEQARKRTKDSQDP